MTMTAPEGQAVVAVDDAELSLLSARQVMALFGVSRSSAYELVRRAGAVRPTPHTLRVSRAALARYLHAQREVAR